MMSVASLAAVLYNVAAMPLRMFTWSAFWFCFTALLMQTGLCKGVSQSKYKNAYNGTSENHVHCTCKKHNVITTRMKVLHVMQ